MDAEQKMAARINQAADRLHRMAVSMFGAHAANPVLKGFVPWGTLGDIDAANAVLTFVEQVKSERRARNSVKRMKIRKVRRPNTRIRRAPLRDGTWPRYPEASEGYVNGR